MKLSKCVCGGQRASRKVICHDCWEAAPSDLRSALRDAADYHATCRAARQLTEWAKTRHRQPELF